MNLSQQLGSRLLPSSLGMSVRVPEGAEPMRRCTDERKVPDTVWGLILFGLIPEVITLFGLLLWVTPVVQAELEGRTWIYLAVRPRGRVSMLLGKYLDRRHLDGLGRLRECDRLRVGGAARGGTATVDHDGGPGRSRLPGLRCAVQPDRCLTASPGHGHRGGLYA